MSVSRPAPLETFTIRPKPRSRMSGMNAWQSRHAPNRIGLEGLPDRAEVHGRALLVPASTDSGIVDEDVEPAGTLSDLVGEAPNAVLVAYVQLAGFDRLSLGGQRLGRRGAPRLIA